MHGYDCTYISGLGEIYPEDEAMFDEESEEEESKEEESSDDQDEELDEDSQAELEVGEKHGDENDRNNRNRYDR